MTSQTFARGGVLAALILVGAVHPVLAQQGDWAARARALVVAPSGDSDPVADLGTVLSPDTGPGLAFEVSYGLTHTLAASLALTTSYHSMDTSGGLAGGLAAGKVWLGSVALCLQYRPGLMGPWHPHFGAGLTYGQPFGFDLDDEAASIGLSDIDFDGDLGILVRAGVEYDLGPRWFLDLELARYTLSSEASITVDPGLPYATVDMDLDPWQVGLSIGRHF